MFDPGCFADSVAGEIRRQGISRLLDLGCGTGLQAIPILDRLGDVEYLGVDGSAAMISIFERKLEARRAGGQCTELRAGVDLRMRAANGTLASLNGGAVLMSQVLQYFPLDPMEETLSKREMMARAVDLAGRGGRVFIVEDVMGEDEREHARLSAEWDGAVVAGYRDNLHRLRGALADVAPRYLDAIRMLVERPAMMPTMRERRRRTRGESILRLSAWRGLLGELGRPFRLAPHRYLGNFYLTVIEC